MFLLILLLLVVAVVLLLLFAYRTPRFPLQPATGALFVTGADSGMGKVSVHRLASLGFTVYAGCYLDKSVEDYNASDENITGVQVDVTSDESVAKAAKTVQAMLGDDTALVGIVNCAGVAFEGPAEYFPIKLFQRQMDVNLMGYVRVTSTFLPLLKAGLKKSGRRGRIVFVGTGGGVPSACPPMISAYMASKWAVEAYHQSLRQELTLRQYAIDCCMINPGVIKPTGLEANGKANLEKAWSMMPKNARTEYEPLMDAFIAFMAKEKGEPPSAIADAMERAMTDAKPPLRYKVGFDSKASPFAGIAPTWLREFAIRKTLMGEYEGPTDLDTR